MQSAIKRVSQAAMLLEARGLRVTPYIPGFWRVGDAILTRRRGCPLGMGTRVERARELAEQDDQRSDAKTQGTRSPQGGAG